MGLLKYLSPIITLLLAVLGLCQLLREISDLRTKIPVTLHIIIDINIDYSHFKVVSFRMALGNCFGQKDFKRSILM